MLSASRSLCAILAVFLTLFSLAGALPVELQQRDVWTPNVLYPSADVVWKIGYTHHVVWDISEKPPQVSNPIGQIWLRKNGSTLSSGPGSSAEPLASGFNLTDGRVLIEVPPVEVGCDYQLVLFGDSGNFSPRFIIAAEGD